MRKAILAPDPGLPGGRMRVWYLRSILVPGDEMCFHLFEAPSAEAVRKAARLAGLAYARIVEAVE